MLLAQTVERLNQISSSKCQARRLQSHRLPAQQSWVCAKQGHEGNPGHAWLLGAGCSTFYTGSSKAHEEMTELPDPEEESLHGPDHQAQGSPGALGVPWAPCPDTADEGCTRATVGSLALQDHKGTAHKECKLCHWQMKHFH